MASAIVGMAVTTTFFATTILIRGAEKVIKKYQLRKQIKKIKMTIYNEVDEYFNDDKIEELFLSLEKLKEFDIEQNTKKLIKKLEKLGLPEDSLDSVELLAKAVEEKKDSLVDKTAVLLKKTDEMFEKMKADFMKKMLLENVKE